MFVTHYVDKIYFSLSKLLVLTVKSKRKNICTPTAASQPEGKQNVSWSFLEILIH